MGDPKLKYGKNLLPEQKDILLLLLENLWWSLGTSGGLTVKNSEGGGEEDPTIPTLPRTYIGIRGKRIGLGKDSDLIIAVERKSQGATIPDIIDCFNKVSDMNFSTDDLLFLKTEPELAFLNLGDVKERKEENFHVMEVGSIDGVREAISFVKKLREQKGKITEILRDIRQTGQKSADEDIKQAMAALLNASNIDLDITDDGKGNITVSADFLGQNPKRGTKDRNWTDRKDVFRDHDDTPPRPGK